MASKKPKELDLTTRSALINPKTFNIVITLVTPIILASETKLLWTPFWRNSKHYNLDIVYHMNERNGRDLQKVLFPEPATHTGGFVPLCPYPEYSWHSATFERPMFNEACNKVIAISTHTADAEPIQILHTEVLVCWKIAELVWRFKGEEKRGDIDMVLASVVTNHLRVLRLLWTPEYHRTFRLRIETLPIRITSFPRNAHESVIQDLRADIETCEAVVQRRDECVTVGEDVTSGEGEDVTSGEGKEVTITEGKEVTVGEGEEVTVGEEVTSGEGEEVTADEEVTSGEGKEVTTAEGKEVTTAEGKEVTVGEGEDVNAGEEVIAVDGEEVTTGKEAHDN